MKVRRIMPVCEATVWEKHGDHPAVRNDPGHPLHAAHKLDPATTGILHTIAGHDWPITPGLVIITLPNGGGHYFHPQEAMKAYEVIEP